MPNNIIDNIRLDKGYDEYVSSVEALNRELKELREYKRRVQSALIECDDKEQYYRESPRISIKTYSKLSVLTKAIMGDELNG